MSNLQHVILIWTILRVILTSANSSTLSFQSLDGFEWCHLLVLEFTMLEEGTVGIPLYRYRIPVDMRATKNLADLGKKFSLKLSGNWGRSKLGTCQVMIVMHPPLGIPTDYLPFAFRWMTSCTGITDHSLKPCYAKNIYHIIISSSHPYKPKNFVTGEFDMLPKYQYILNNKSDTILMELAKPCGQKLIMRLKPSSPRRISRQGLDAILHQLLSQSCPMYWYTFENKEKHALSFYRPVIRALFLPRVQSIAVIAVGVNFFSPVSIYTGFTFINFCLSSRNLFRKSS